MYDICGKHIENYNQLCKHVQLYDMPMPCYCWFHFRLADILSQLQIIVKSINEDNNTETILCGLLFIKIMKKTTPVFVVVTGKMSCLYL